MAEKNGESTDRSLVHFSSQSYKSKFLVFPRCRESLVDSWSIHSYAFLTNRAAFPLCLVFGKRGRRAPGKDVEHASGKHQEAVNVLVVLVQWLESNQTKHLQRRLNQRFSRNRMLNEVGVRQSILVVLLLVVLVGHNSANKKRSCILWQPHVEDETNAFGKPRPADPKLSDGSNPTASHCSALHEVADVATWRSFAPTGQGAKECEWGLLGYFLTWVPLSCRGRSSSTWFPT